jgi:hypothetical protein
MPIMATLTNLRSLWMTADDRLPHSEQPGGRLEVAPSENCRSGSNFW